MTDYPSKECTKCLQAKPLEAFTRNKRSRDGLDYRCRACKSARYMANRESVLAGVKARYQKKRDEILAYQREYHIANRDEQNEYRRRWHAENPGRHKAYKARNKPMYWESNYRARSFEFGFDPVVRSFTERDLIEMWGSQCVHCGGPFEELDHYPVAVAVGGEHALENCRPSCRSCNRKQGPHVRLMREQMGRGNADYFASPRAQVEFENSFDNQIGVHRG